MTERLRLDGRVLVVTGAGRGIGAAHAIHLAQRGASVMVNDLGGSMGGAGSDTEVGGATVDRIRDAGGTAAMDPSDISTTEGAESLVEHALSQFGRLDGVVNNAGIYWTDRFPDVTLDDLHRQWSVHVGGSFNVTRAAWPHLIASGQGRVVMTTSTGALGSSELAAYGTAKAGVLGLGRALAHAGEPHGIKVNVLAPMAMTRMMNARGNPADPDDVPADPLRAPGLVSPLVAILCSEQCQVTGRTFVSGMRRVSQLSIVETNGYVHPGVDLTPEDLLDNWSRITDLSQFNEATGTMSWSVSNSQFLDATPSL